ncbi:MAG: rubrerythrin family protein [Clostridia bacterium]|nr:rubrerythrin family protein [Clostridia bacterium]
MDFENSRTKANLLAAFAGESQARNKYTFYAAKARQEGYEQIGEIFDETAQNEKEHAELWLKLWHGGELPGTFDNLNDAAGGEHYEWTEMYAEFAKTAREEGFNDIAAAMELVANIENAHEQRYRKLMSNLQSGEVFKRKPQTVWICMNCGHLHTGETPPKMCPVCKKPQAYFKLHVADY